ncbi:hypothetical protein [Paenibacillus lignilyticus]|uniref:Uncharacterized protein n=1 Tax=Paenibacillus lignilyticus TaxID=1172615 RepID=A0ABS5CL09_9BACL|nr:hypothetical protein [Paenibacillus lignilyticus]MBP3966548.1 hypothetical protein [Paenibacillus lignilyticus]
MEVRTVNDDNIINFKPRKAIPAPLTEAEQKRKLTQWENGFTLYVFSVGLQEIAKTSEIVSATDTQDKMYQGIRYMAESNYPKMLAVVTNELLIQRAFVGKEDLHAELHR